MEMVETPQTRIEESNIEINDCDRMCGLARWGPRDVVISETGGLSISGNNNHQRGVPYYLLSDPPTDP